MANIWKHPQVIAAEALRHLEDALIIGPLCARDLTSDFSTKANGWKIGDTVSFRTHGEYAVKEFGGTIDVQPITSSTRPLTIEKHFDISVEVTSREETLDLDSFSEQVIRPATYKLAESVDSYLGTKILQAQGLYTSANLLGSAADIALARKAATLQQLAMNRFALVDLDAEATLLGQEWFNQSSKRGSDAEASLRTGVMGEVMGMNWFSSIAFPTNLTPHTAGTGTAATDNSGGANVIGDSELKVTATTAQINAGDRLAIAGCRRPVVVQTDAAPGVTTIELSMPITEIVQDAAAVTVIGSGKDLTYNGAIFDSRSLGVAMPMLDLPQDKVSAAASANGVSIRMVKGYGMHEKKTTLSLDLLVGAFTLDPRRITLLADES